MRAFQRHFGALHVGAVGDHVAPLDLDLRSQRLEPAQVEIDRPGADRAPAGEAHPCPFQPRQHRAHHVGRGAHLAHHVVRRLVVAETGRVDPHPVVFVVNPGAQFAQHAGHRLDVAQVGHVAQGGCAVGQQAGNHQRQRGVLRPADVNFARKAAVALYQKSIHGSGPNRVETASPAPTPGWLPSSTPARPVARLVFEPSSCLK
ncbi:MAG: hypothetical protein BWZ08_02755 [candidate division BRC1 bacterium ADurb.BinA292]|nr:MAG: hypothetical protein BWZ08_02755 [candidate division BRC1 bacterium ADurb.BinA292]